MNSRDVPELNGRYDYSALMVEVAVVCIRLYRYLRKVHWL
jgi:Mg2+ and Co2+ transporter CorA